MELAYEVHGSGEAVVLITGSLVPDEYLSLAAEPALGDYMLVRYHRRGTEAAVKTGPSTIRPPTANLLARLDKRPTSSASLADRLPCKSRSMHPSSSSR
jgi:hypothetical protein